MRPVLFSIGGLDIQTYGVSKVLAALLAAYLLGRAFERHSLKKDDAHSLVMWATIWGFVGAKIYHLLENLGNLSWHHLGGSGFTWYGGLIGGVISAVVIVRRRRLPLPLVADLVAIPLSLAYAVGRIGCWFSGDGTYGKPTDLPWGMRVTGGVMPTDVAVHPTPLYEALASVAIAALLWAILRRSHARGTVFAWYLILSGIARFAVEFLRLNEVTFLGLTQPQLWSVASVVVGIVLIARLQATRAPADGAVGEGREVTNVPSSGEPRV